MTDPHIVSLPPTDPPSAPTDPGMTGGTGSITKHAYYVEVKFFNASDVLETRCVDLYTGDAALAEQRYEDFCAQGYLQLGHDIQWLESGPDASIGEGYYDDERVSGSRIYSMQLKSVKKKWTVTTTVTPVP